ncbi:hypothetical protein EV184_101254 [Sinorhizobium americanum]|uniref:Uncharacterized protein n=1 Tax=Sinorhizobium americanum TaxID=194963 RepID=A0A4R2C6S2_9HYPH|nr:hypothetical protein EV184_101254 [Sinorhizobium americanum]
MYRYMMKELMLIIAGLTACALLILLLTQIPAAPL